MRSQDTPASLRISHRHQALSLALMVGLSAPFLPAAPAAAAQRLQVPISEGGAEAQERSAHLALLAPAPLPPALPLSTPYAITPERRALLNTIRYAEGTWADGQPIGYRIIFGGSLVDRLDQHPNRLMRSRTSRYVSAAAGAYQFMPFTWAMASRALGLPDFGPEHQDQAAIFLIQRRGALALADQGLLTPELTARLAPEWASLPTLVGASYYGQPVRRYTELRQFYESNLAALRQAAGPSDLAQGPEACDSGSGLCQSERIDQRP